MKEIIIEKLNLLSVDNWIQLIIALLWGIYVFYTGLTFKEVQKQTKEFKKQTELNNNAYLIIEKYICKEIKHPVIDMIPKRSKELYEEWAKIVKDNADAGSSEEFLVLELKNRGGCDITGWDITLELDIEPSEYLKNKSRIRSEEGEKINISSNDYVSVIEKEDSIKIAVFKLGSFPEINFDLAVKYTDMRNKKYSEFGGIKKINHRNALAHLTDKDKESNKEVDSLRNFIDSIEDEIEEQID